MAMPCYLLDSAAIYVYDNISFKYDDYHTDIKLFSSRYIFGHDSSRHEVHARHHAMPFLANIMSDDNIAPALFYIIRCFTFRLL